MANHAIVIGINAYANPAWNLVAAVDDAVRFATWARDRAGVPEKNLHLLLSGAPTVPTDLPHEEATRAMIGDALNAFVLSKRRTAGRLYFYYAGHGVSAAGITVAGIQQPVLIPADVTALETRDYLLLGFSDIMPKLADVGPREQFFFIDACRDFRLERDFTAGVPGYAGRWVRPSTSAGPRNAQYVMYATSPGLRSYERRLVGRGVFGTALLAGLAGGGSAARWVNGQYEVRFNSLMLDVRDQVRRELDQVRRADGAQFIQLPEPETRSGDPDPVLATFPDLPKVQVRVRVAPSEALPTCAVEAGFSLPGGEYQRAVAMGPPVPGTSTFSLRPGDYVVRATAVDYREHRSPLSIYSAITVPVRLKPAPARRKVGGRGPRVPDADALQAPSPIEFSVPGAPTPPVAGAGAALTGRLEASTEDPAVLVVVWDSAGAVIETKLGTVDKEVPAGIYRVQLMLPEGPVADHTIEVQAGQRTKIVLECPPPPIGRSQRDMLAALDIRSDPHGYVGASEYLPKLASPPLASLLSFAAFAAHWPQAGAFERLRSMGVMTLRGVVPPGQAGVIVIVGASGDHPAPGIDRERFLEDGEFVVRDASGTPVLRDRLDRLAGFPAAAQNGVPTTPGPTVVEVRLPGLDPTRYALTALKDRVSVLVIVATDGARFDVQQYSLPLGAVTIPGPAGQVIDEYLSMDPTHIRGVELAQRYYLSGQDIPHAGDIDVLLVGKWFDPLLACIAGYSLVRQGRHELFKVAMGNMLAHFGDLADSHVLAGLCEPSKRTTHFRNALKAGLPIFSDGLRALHDWSRDRPDTPRTLTEAARRLIPGSPWTVWVAFRPALLVKDESFAPAPVGWQLLEQHRAAVEATLGSAGRISIKGSGGIVGLGCGFVVAPDLVMTTSFIAHALAERKGRRWVMNASLRGAIEFRAEAGRKRPSTREFRIRGIRAIDEANGFALLEIEPLKGAHVQAPPALVLSRRPRGPIEGRPVYVVGHPHTEPMPNANVDHEVVSRVFGRQSAVKRVQPGVLLGTRDRAAGVGVKARGGTIDHDCFTLPGDAGAPLVDLETGRVVGIHEGSSPSGDYKEGFALRLWSLVSNPKLKAAGVRFE